MTEEEHHEAIPSEADQWPIDIRSLTKGQDIPSSQCEEIMGVRQSSARYPFAMLAFRAWIMTESARIGIPLSVSMRAGGLHINSDGEASRYHAKLAKDAERSVFRNFGHLCRTVNAAALSDQERAAHETRVRVLALKTAALKSARKEIGIDQQAIETDAE